MLKLLMLIVLVALTVTAQSAKIEPADTPLQRPEKVEAKRNITLFTGDNVIPQFVDGAGWSTSITFVNLETYTFVFSVYFVGDAGNDLSVDVVGLGPQVAVKVTLPANNTINVATSGTAAQLKQGWALVDRDDDVAGIAIFKQRVAGRQDQEAVVPITSQYESTTMLLFDNTSATTGVAIANPYAATTIFALIRDQNGAILGTRSLSLPTLGHTALDMGSTWPETAGKRGTVQFTTSRLGVSVLGLRFNGGAFTSIHSLEALSF